MDKKSERESERGREREKDSRCCVRSGEHSVKFTPLSVAGDNGNSSRQVSSAANLAGDSQLLNECVQQSNEEEEYVLAWHWLWEECVLPRQLLQQYKSQLF